MGGTSPCLTELKQPTSVNFRFAFSRQSIDYLYTLPNKLIQLSGIDIKNMPALNRTETTSESFMSSKLIRGKSTGNKECQVKIDFKPNFFREKISIYIFFYVLRR